MSQQSNEWTIHLTPADVSELEAAMQHFNSTQKDVAHLTAHDFPLPTLAPRLLAIRHDLLHGRGFVLLRGLPVTKYTRREACVLFFGVGCHIGRPRSQNAAGHLLGHVQDLGKSSSDPNVRIYQTAERQTFHTDSADVVGLLCLQTSQSGGLSLLVSSTTVFNEMRLLRPDLLALLMQPIATDRRGEVPAGELPYYLIPVFTYEQGFLTCMYQRQYIDSAQRFPDAPRLTARHVAALDMFDELANASALHFSMQLLPGDIQFVYNHALLHDRTAFVDWPEASRKRHLLRLWLAIPDDRPLASVFAAKYGNIRVGERGGIIVPETQLQVPL